MAFFMTARIILPSLDDFSYRQEVHRKLLHLSSLWIPLSIYSLNQTQATVLIGVAFALSVAFEVLRRQTNSFSVLLLRVFSPIIRARECQTRFCLTGSTYMLAASLLVCLFFPKPIAITALCIMLIGDTAAALIGRTFGKTRILDKSLEGCAAFLLASLATVIALSILAGFPHRFMIGGLFASITATAAELVSGVFNLDDNLTITLVAACTMLLVMDSL